MNGSRGNRVREVGFDGGELKEGSDPKKTINKNEVILMGEILKWLNIILNGRMMAAQK